MRTLFVICALLFSAVSAHAYERYVVANDVAVQYDGAGNIRFCEYAKLRGNICQQESNFFGKKVRSVADWWYPETYVQAVTGVAAQVTRVEPTGNGIVIFFEVGGMRNGW